MKFKSVLTLKEETINIFYFVKRAFINLTSFSGQFSRLQRSKPTKRQIVSMDLKHLLECFSGVRIWRVFGELDWPLFVPELFSKNLILIGGHTGTLTLRLLERIPKLVQIHVYEPIEEFSKLAPLSEKVTNFSEAIFSYSGQLEIKVAGDHTFVPETGRAVYVNQTLKSELVPCITFRQAFERIGASDVSLIMNCEGSEYFILRLILEEEILPKSIIFQSHKTGERPYLELRAKLSEKYMPVFCADWAWDIWILDSSEKKSSQNGSGE